MIDLMKICKQCKFAKYPYEFPIISKKYSESAQNTCKQCNKAARRPLEGDILRKNESLRCLNKDANPRRKW
jgi:hypothetical protein